MDYTIYHNPRCKKSRETLALLKENKIEPTVVKYLDDPLDEKGLESVCSKLGIEATKLLRKTEAIYKENYKGKDLSHDDAIKAMAKHPKLMERPVVVKGDKAVIGRPPENVLELV
ncbi:MAG: arsenate reductase (glutaredoxin) [Saprospirales bacterium]|nr:MAG: arsenate reductase (glutaredoxin) [Saprospirales bacterium]